MRDAIVDDDEDRERGSERKPVTSNGKRVERRRSVVASMCRSEPTKLKFDVEIEEEFLD